MMKTFSTVPGDKEKKKNISCALCGTESQENIFLKCEGFVFSQCKKCKLVFQNPQPLEEELMQRYKKEYFIYEKENEESFYDLIRMGLNDIGFDKIEKRTIDKKTFLDVGCATGLLLSNMKKKGWDVKGVEVCREAALYGIEERGVDISIGPFKKAVYSDKAFFIIHASHLIEHLARPESFFEDAFRILDDNGYLIITTPNIDGFQSKIFKEKWRSAIADHMYLFSKKTLKKLIKKSGFYIVKSKTWGGLAVGSVPGSIKKIFDILAKVFNFGDVMIFLLKKKTG